MHTPIPSQALAVASLLVCLGAPAGAEPIDRDFDVKTGGTLTLDFDRVAGRLDIQGWDRNQIHVEGDVDDGELDFEATETGLDVAPRGRHDEVDVDLTIKVPREFRLRISTTTGTHISDVSGDIQLTGANDDFAFTNVRGTASIGTANGRLRIDNCNLDGRISNTNGRLLIDDSDVRGKVTAVNANLTVSRAPEGLVVSTVNGHVQLEHAAEHVRANTTNGSVKILALEGSIEAETVNGDVDIKMVGSPDGKRTVEIETLNGDVDVEIPANFSMEFDVEVRNEDDDDRVYEIVSDFELDISGPNPSRDGEKIRAKGSIEGGRNLVRIRAANGDVYLRRASS
jgi:DUF4097 and DUF4098 domain-containing protein YvlB